MDVAATDPNAEALNALALAGKLPTAYGRDREVDDVLRALASPGSLCPLLIGPPRGGKTALAHHVANRIARGECPDALRDLRVFETTPTRLLSAFGPPAMLAARLGESLPKLAGAPVILFVRDFHVAAGMGTLPDDTRPDLAQIVNDLMQGARPRLLFEARQRAMEAAFAERASLKSLFSLVHVNALPRDEAMDVARRARDDLEIIYEINVADDALDEALDLAARFQVNEALPGPILDLLKDTLATFDAAAGGAVTRAEVRRRFIQRSGLPEFLVSDEAPYDEPDARAFLTRRVFGQEAAVEAVLRMIALARVRLNNPLRPMGVFLFLGPTGVGKTELVKALAQYLFGGAERIVRFNMADYVEDWTMRLLFGDPWGDTESERQGRLWMQLSGQSFAVLLLDEFEKASPLVNQRFLQLFDEGILINGQGEELNLRNTIIVLTSNLGARLVSAGLGFKLVDPLEDAERAVMRASETYFQPEFINRLDAVCFFKPLSRHVTRQIAQREIGEVIARDGIQRRRLRVSVDDSAIDLMVERGYDLQFGARYLKRQIERSITYPLARQIARKRIEPGAAVRLFARNGEIVVGLLDERADEADETKLPATPPAGAAAPASVKELQARLDGLSARLDRLIEQHNIAELKARVARMMDRIGEPEFWQDADAAGAQIEEMNAASQRVDQMEHARQLRDRCADALARAVAIPAGARRRAAERAGALAEADRCCRDLARELPLAELMLCLREPEDQGAAFVAVQAVADEAGQFSAAACEWARDMARMYMAWAESRSFTTTVLHEHGADAGEGGARPAGVREALIHIDGFGAYALLKGETGSHRLTMAAPGKRNGARLTVWARVEVLPAGAVAARNAAREVKVETRPMREPASLVERLTRSATITPLRQLTGRVIVWRNNLTPDVIEPLAARYVMALAARGPAQMASAESLDADGVALIRDQVRAYSVFKQHSVRDLRTQHSSTQPGKVLAGALDDFLLAYLEFESNRVSRV